MKLLILGSGGREHAFAWKCVQDARVTHIFVAPGNAGTANEPRCSNVALNILDNLAVVDFCHNHAIDIVLVGPEAPLVNGVVDACRAAGIAIWGPTQFAAQLEGSKAYAKNFLKKYHIPTAAYQVFTDIVAAKTYIQAQGAPIVIKADGLAAGKGVVVAQTVTEALAAADDMLSSNKFGEAGSRIVVEQCLLGEEASFICMIDGKNVLPMATSQDHKRIFEHDLGPNTGGMGAYSPAPVVDDMIFNRVLQEIIYPTLHGMKAEGESYTGFLYAGLMIDAQNNPYVIEFNCRFGDPETQPVLMRLKSSLVELLEKGLKGQLPVQAEWLNEKSVGIVLAAAGYPGDIQVADEIHGLAQQMPQCYVFQAGTCLNEQQQTVTNGGRVLCVTALGDTVAQAQQRALARIAQLSFSGMQFRRDIGYRAIEREHPAI